MYNIGTSTCSSLILESSRLRFFSYFSWGKHPVLLKLFVLLLSYYNVYVSLSTGESNGKNTRSLRFKWQRSLSAGFGLLLPLEQTVPCAVNVLPSNTHIELPHVNGKYCFLRKLKSLQIAPNTKLPPIILTDNSSLGDLNKVQISATGIPAQVGLHRMGEGRFYPEWSLWKKLLSPGSWGASQNE